MLSLFFLLIYLAPGTLTRVIPPLSIPTLFSVGLSKATSTYPVFTTTSPLLPHSRDASTCTCPRDLRSIWDIIWSCLTVIFACSWVSVHPNVPTPDEKWWRNPIRRVEYLVWTLMVPELIVWWAARQWLGARKIQKEQKDRGWTVSHGHFIQMGGFMLFKGNTRIGTLSYPRFCQLLKKGQIQFPEITQTEIEDRSKSDAVSKTLVIAQTSWFIIQCIARGVRDLPLTELELLTLALAALNGIMYFFWWNKPIDVQCPYPIHLILPTENKVAPTSNHGIMADKFVTPKPTSNDETIPTSRPPQEANQRRQQFPESFHQMYTSCLTWSGWKRMAAWPSTLALSARKTFTERFKSLAHDNRDEFQPPHFYSRKNEWGNIPGFMCAPMFYSLNPQLSPQITIAGIYLPGSLFGAIHCAGWAYQFPTTAELWLWRISSVIITAAPLLIPVLGIFVALVRMSRGSSVARAARNWVARIPMTWLARLARAARNFVERVPRTWLARAESIWEWLLTAGAILLLLPLPSYFLARLVLLAEAILTLRDLPARAFDVVRWTSFLPHI